MAGYDGLVDRPKPVLRYVVSAALLILLGVLVWILIASNNSKSNKPATTTPASSSTQTTTPPSSTETTPSAPSGTSTPSSTPSTSGQPGASTGTTSTPAPSGGTSSSQPQLADTGPGETIALFLGVTLIASIFHHRRQTKRQSLTL